jgi:hypothetical protein
LDYSFLKEHSKSIDMKHIYIEVSEDMYTDAKEIGFFEIAEHVREKLRIFIKAHKEHKNNGRSNP